MKQKMSFFLGVFLAAALLVVLPLSANSPVWAQEEVIETTAYPEEIAPVERTVEQMLADAEALALAGVESQCEEVPILPGVDKELKIAALSEPGRSAREEFPDNEPLAPPVLSTNWFGLNKNQAGDCGSTWRPPDTMIAAGVGNVATVYNVHYAVYRTNDQSLRFSVPFSAFLGYTATCTFDPQVMFDKVWRKWVVAIEGRSETPTLQRQFIAITRSWGNPQAGYFIYNYNTRIFTGGNTSAIVWDYPKLGMDQDAVLLTANAFNVDVPADRRAFLNTFAKIRIYTGNTVTIWGFGPLKWTLVPPYVWDPNPNTYLIAAPRPDVEAPNKVWKYTLTNSSRNPPTLSGPVAIPVTTYAFPPSAQQPGTSATLDTMDCRFTHYSTQIGDSLFNVHTVNSAGLPTPFYYEFDTEGTNANTVKQVGSFFASASSNDWMPGIMANLNRDIFVVWSSTNPGAGLNAQMRIGGKRVGDATTFLGPGTLVYQSSTFYTEFRWGDYQNVDVNGGLNWGDQDVAFAFAEVILGTTTWGSRIARIRFP